MIAFNKLKWRNFLSYGNDWNEFEFQKGITSIQGANGFGKSVLEDVLCYVLYNKAYRDINLSKLVNLKNKSNLEVELYFTKNNKKHKVRRTMKMKGEADFFGVFEEVQGEWVLIPQSAHKKDYQKQFEENILGMSRYYFEMIVIKSSLKPLSFISLPKKDRMGFMDNIFSIHLFDHITKQNKDFLKALKDDRLVTENTLDLKKGYLEQQKALIAESEKQLNDVIQQQINENREKRGQIIEDLEKYKKASTIMDKFKTKNAVLHNNKRDKERLLRTTQDEVLQHKTNINVSKNKMLSFEKYCQGCEKFELIKKDEKIDVYLAKIEELELYVDNNITNDLSSINKQLKDMEEFLAKDYEISSTLSRLKSEFSHIDDKLKQLEVEINKKVEKPIIKNIESDIEELIGNVSTLDFNERHEQLIKKLIQPLKFYIVRRWMPYFNLTLNEYLYKFGIDIHAVFDEQFKETVRFKNGDEVDYNALSNGQKKRLALSIMLSLMDLSKKIKNQSYNLLIMDEVIDGLDQEGVSSLLEILKEKEDMELIFIAHNVQLEDSIINRRIEISKEQGFSKFNYVT